MGTTSEKLTYLNTTKGKIKDSINLTGANITNEPFRQYSTKLENAYIDIINNGTDTLYNNFPKVSGEGTSLTLNNTYQAPMRNNLKGNTSQTGTPTPTSPIPVNVVSGDNKVNIVGKNWLNNEMESGTLNSTGQTDTSLTGVIRTKNYSIVKPSTQYTLSNDKNYACYIYEYDKNYNFITSYTGGAYQTTPKDITTNSNTKYVKVRSISNQSDLSVKYMLNEGNSASTYVPYQGNTYNIDLPEGIELCKIGNYQDYFYKDSGKWYLHKEIGKVVLNGSENWTYVSARGGFTIDYTNVTFSLRNTTVYDGFSNYFMVNKSSTTWVNVNYCGWSATNVFWLQDNGNIATSVNDFKTWLSSNNVSVYYILATSTNTEITDTTLINQLEELYIAKSKENQTNISQINNDLGFIISASALKKG